MMLIPGFGEESVPARVKLTFGLLLSLAIYPIVSAKFAGLSTDDFQLGTAIVSEVVIGLMFGAFIKMMFSAVTIAGSVISTQTGLAMAAVFDPSMGGQNPVLSRFLSISALVLIFATNTHHILLAGMVRSYEMFQPGADIMMGDMAQMALMTVAKAFSAGIQMAAPFLLYGFLFNAALGFVARLTPTIQVFFVAQPLNMLFSFGILLVTCGLMLALFLDYFVQSLQAFVG